MGINSTISISNTMKMTAKRKNRIENGIRADRIGSNPHSNGDSFSRFDKTDFIEVNVEIRKIRGGSEIAMMEDIRISNI